MYIYIKISVYLLESKYICLYVFRYININNIFLFDDR